VRAVAEAADFHSRQPSAKPRRGRRRTGRTEQFACRITPCGGRDDLQDIGGAGLDRRRHGRAGVGGAGREDAKVNGPQVRVFPVGTGEAAVGIGDGMRLFPWGSARRSYN
jgi:hypothetical protein